MKLRYKGWSHEFWRMQRSVELLILGTPTSELRNKLTELNMAIMAIEEFAKNQKEVV